MVTNFLAVSTKSKFKFYCNQCLTNLVTSLVDSEARKFDILEKEYDFMERKLGEIKGLLTKKKKNLKKLETVKAPPSKSLLVVKRSEDEETPDENQSVVENTIMTNNISAIESCNSKSGDLMVVCEPNGGLWTEWWFVNQMVVCEPNGGLWT